MDDKEALEKGIITTKDNYSSKQIWAGRAPRQVISRLTILLLNTVNLQMRPSSLNSLMSISFL